MKNRVTASVHEMKSLSPNKITQMAEVPALSKDQLAAMGMLYADMPNKKVLNSYRELRVKLLERSGGKNFVCLVCSISSNVTSRLSLNLASVFALDKNKTSLLVDANLYNPQVNELLSHNLDAGLTDYIDEGGLGVEQVVYASGIPRLRIIPAGSNSEGAAEYFSSHIMSAMVDEVRSRYADRFVFIRGPECSHVAEVKTLAALCDFVVLDVPYARSNQTQLDDAIEAVGEDKLAGLVFSQ